MRRASAELKVEVMDLRFPRVDDWILGRRREERGGRNVPVYETFDIC